MISTVTENLQNEPALLPARVQKPRLEALTSLRFFAAGMIVLMHYSSSLNPQILLAIKQPALHQGVSFFFVLSGFILTYVYPKLDGLPAIAKFLRARLARIYPTHLLGLGLSIVLLHPLQLTGDYFQLLFLNLFLLQDWLPVTASYWSFNSPSWSISCELFFYLVFPLLIYKFRLTWKMKLLFCVALSCMTVFSNCVFKFPNDASGYAVSADWFSVLAPTTRLLEFAVGMFTAYLFGEFSNRKQFGRFQSTCLEALLIVATISALYLPFIGAELRRVNILELTGWMGASAGTPIYALLIFVFAASRGRVSKFLSYPFFVLLGEISYAMYLIHCPVISFIALHRNAFSGIPPALLMIGCFGFILNLSYLVFEIFEKPVRQVILGKFGKFAGRLELPQKPAVRLSLCGAAVMVSIACALLLRSQS